MVLWGGVMGWLVLYGRVVLNVIVGQCILGKGGVV